MFFTLFPNCQTRFFVSSTLSLVFLLIFIFGLNAQAKESECSIKPNPKWTGIEKHVWEGICTGPVVDLSNLRKENSSSGSLPIRSRFLEEIMRDHKYQKALEPFGIHLIGAKIEGAIELARATLSYPLRLEKCIFDEGASLEQVSPFVRFA